MKKFKDLKSLNKFIKHLISPFIVGIIVTFLVIYAAQDYYAHRGALLGKEKKTIAGLVQEIHEKTIDWRMTDRGLAAGSENVAILAIDDESINLEGVWPWSRAMMAKLVDRSLLFGAKSVSFDMVFSEEAGNSQLAMSALSELKTSVKQSPEVAALVEDQMGKVDVDRVFGATIKAGANQLIMGSFFRGDLVTPPYSELCLDARFDKSYAGGYWHKEALPIQIIDPGQADAHLRSSLSEHLSNYFFQLGVNAANVWFDKNQEVSAKIKTVLGDLGSGLEAEIYPGLAVLVNKNDFESGKALLSQVSPAFNDVENVRRLYSRYQTAFQGKEWSELKTALAGTSYDYCSRFFTGDDELLNKAAYLKHYDHSKEAEEQFEAFSWQSFWDQLKKDDPKTYANETFEQGVQRLKSTIPPILIPQVNEWTVDIPLLAESTMHTGYFNAFQDTDGSVRRSRLVTRHGNTYMPSLAFKTFLVNNGFKAVIKIGMAKVGRSEASRVIEALDVNDANDKFVMSIPVDYLGNLMINYSGPQSMFPHVSASDILSDGTLMRVTWKRFNAATGTWNDEKKVVNKRDFMKDKMLVLGATAVGVYDLRVTPFDENYAGVETHANVLSNLLVEYARLHGDKVDPKAPGFLKTHPAEERYMWMFLLVAGVTLAWLLNHYGSIAGLGITALALLIVYAVDKFYLFRSGYVITSMFPVVLIVVNFVVLTFYKYFGEERNKRALKGTFEKYVSPAIVAEVLADPSNIELGGKKMELTVMFSDVRGFTTISEKLDPRALSDLLNSYLTPMTNLVFENKGTLDKYMGDAIMAFWGAPIHFPDHAKHACRCALRMLVKLKELQAEYRAQGLPEIDIGIGLNTGDMSVGNMGSDTVRSYTVMGDAVNLGSRLEGINKQYGTRIIISEFTFKEVKDGFTCREVDWVRVKGKAQPVRIFELMNEGPAPAPTEELLKYFNAGFSLYHEMKFPEAIVKFNEALAVNSEDPLSQLYLERCQDYLTEAPPENWDGVFTMTSK